MTDKLSRKDRNLVKQEFLKTINNSIDEFVVDYSDDNTEWRKELTRYVNELAAEYRKKLNNKKETPREEDYWIGYCKNSPSKIQKDVFDSIVKTFGQYLGLPASQTDAPEGTVCLRGLFWDDLSVKFMKKNPFKGCDNDRAESIKKKIDDDFCDALCLLFDGLNNVGRANGYYTYDYE